MRNPGEVIDLEVKGAAQTLNMASLLSEPPLSQWRAGIMMLFFILLCCAETSRSTGLGCESGLCKKATPLKPRENKQKLSTPNIFECLMQRNKPTVDNLVVVGEPGSMQKQSGRTFHWKLPLKTYADGLESQNQTQPIETALLKVVIYNLAWAPLRTGRNDYSSCAYTRQCFRPISSGSAVIYESDEALQQWTHSIDRLGSLRSRDIQS